MFVYHLILCQAVNLPKKWIERTRQLISWGDSGSAQTADGDLV